MICICIRRKATIAYRIPKDIWERQARKIRLNSNPKRWIPTCNDDEYRFFAAAPDTQARVDAVLTSLLSTAPSRWRSAECRSAVICFSRAAEQLTGSPISHSEISVAFPGIRLLSKNFSIFQTFNLLHSAATIVECAYVDGKWRDRRPARPCVGGRAVQDGSVRGTCGFAPGRFFSRSTPMSHPARVEHFFAAALIQRFEKPATMPMCSCAVPFQPCRREDFTSCRDTG